MAQTSSGKSITGTVVGPITPFVQVSIGKTMGPDWHRPYRSQSGMFEEPSLRSAPLNHPIGIGAFVRAVGI